MVCGGAKIEADWYDFDNDGYLDIFFEGYGRYGAFDELNIYRNTGNNTFFQAVNYSFSADISSSDLGDFDNDGDIDILILNEYQPFILINNGGFEFVKQDYDLLSGADNGNAKFVDYNNDGFLDIFFTGNFSNSAVSKLYKNLNGNNFEELTGITIPAIWYAAASWGDFSGDGLLDLAIADGNETSIYTNLGNDSFALLTDTIAGAANGASMWGDLDNDGDMDLVSSGQNSYGNKTHLSINNGGIFTYAGGLNFDSVRNSSIDLGDYDNDGDLDILLSGNNGVNKICKVFRNDLILVNPTPGAPTNPSVQLIGPDAILSWDPVTSDNTSAAGMSYNIALGSAPGTTDIIHPGSSNLGYYRRTGPGNTQLNTSRVLRNLPKGNTYYWKVQAIDNSFIGGGFSTESQFTYNYSYQAYNLNNPLFDGSAVTLTWSRGNGDNCAVFMKEGTDDTTLPSNSGYYFGSDIFGLGIQIGSTGWYCVYSGPNDSTIVKGLTPNTDYVVKAFEYDGGTGEEIFNTAVSAENVLEFTSGSFSELRNLNLLPNTDDGAGLLTFSYWIDIENDNDLDLLQVGNTGSYLYRNDSADLFNITNAFISGHSAACSDINNDGYVDIIIIATTESKIYINSKDGTFEEPSVQSVPGILYGSVDFGDYDNDGDEDLSLTGSLSGERITKIYSNNGDTTFSVVESILLPGVMGIGAEVKWADYDNDGFLDLLISGTTNSLDKIASIYRNFGNNEFIEQTGIALDAAYMCTYTWADVNSDGYLDILMAHAASNSIIYLNDGNNNFSVLPGTNFYYSESGAMSAGDYDMDGDIDVLLCGRNQNKEPFIKLYKNQNMVFTEDTTLKIPGVEQSSASFGDYDNDGDLDIAVSGYSLNGPIAKIFRNEWPGSNSVPSAPVSTNDSINLYDVVLSWNSVETDETPAAALSYNVRVGTSTFGSEVTSPLAGFDGFRRIAELGNAYLDTTYLLKNLPFNRYYWQVQAVDQNHAGGLFSALDSFDLVPIQSSKLSARILSPSSLSLHWKRGNGERCIVFCMQSGTDTVNLADSLSYIADNEFGFGEEIANTEWYCVYNGRADSAIVNGLIPNIDYSFQIFEYTGGFGFEDYFSILSDGNPGVFSTGLFSKHSSVSFLNHNNSYSYKASWGDFNNDGYIDLILPNFTDTTRIFENNGDNTFTERKDILLDRLIYGSASWGDYDNDGDLDILLTGATQDFVPRLPVAKIYKNNGGNSFVEQTGIGLTGVYYSSGEWGDYDNDGDLDILITGATADSDPYNPISKVYKNNGDNSFTEQTGIIATGVLRGTGKWADLDTDGDLDIMIMGSLDNEVFLNNTCQILINQGDGSFIDKGNAITLSSYTDLLFGDYDNDSDLDLITTRHGRMSVYTNDGDANFNLLFLETIGWNDASAANWIDYNNDGFLDIIMTNPTLDTKIFKNTGGNLVNGNWFYQADDESVSTTGNHHVSCVDFDNDGDTDFLMMNKSAENKLYKNNSIMKSGEFPVNTPPDAPTNLRTTFEPGKIILGWDPIETDETPSPNMSYNLKVGTKPDSLDLISPQSDSNGFRSIVAMGNAQMDNSHTFSYLPTSKYYWKVQAVDMVYTGGSWSALDSFEVRNMQTFFEFDTVCSGLPTTFIDQSTSTEGIDSWFWDFGDGSTSTQQFPVYTFGSSGTHSVKLMISSGVFKDSISKDVLVYARPTANFTASLECQGSPTSFTNSTATNGTVISQWLWDFGNGSNYFFENPPVQGYFNPGEYTAKLLAISDKGCADSAVNTVTVAAYPFTNIATGGATVFCNGDSVKLSMDENENYNYQWYLDGLTISGADSSVHYAKSSGAYTVQATNSIGSCTSLTQTPATITVNPTPDEPFIQESGSTTICDGDSVILSSAYNAEYEYRWKLNGGAVGDNTDSLEVRIDGNYRLVVLNAQGCRAFSSNIITVIKNPSPISPNLSMKGVREFCEGDSVEFSVVDDPALTYQWKNGVQNIANATSHILISKTTGNYYLKVTNSSGCSSTTFSEPVTVYPTPSSPTISVSGDTTFCSGDSVTLSASLNPAYEYYWLVDGGVWEYNVAKFKVNFPGSISLEVVDVNNFFCSSLSTNTIKTIVYPSPPEPPVDYFGFPDFCDGDSLVISVPDDPAYTYQWKKDGTNIAGKTSHSYAAKKSGKYNVSITNADGCSTENWPDQITVYSSPPSPTISVSGDTIFCEGDSVTLSTTLNPAYDYQWMRNGFPWDYNVAKLNVDLPGEFSLEVADYSNIGCFAKSTNTVNVSVHSAPGDKFVFIEYFGNCEGDSVFLSVQDDPLLDYQWKRDGISITDATSFEYTAKQSGKYTLNATNANGCATESFGEKFTFFQTPLSPTLSNSGETTFCFGDSVTLTTSSVSGLEYYWLRNDEYFENGTNNLVTYLPGDYTLEVVNSDYCSAYSTNSILVSVNQRPAPPDLNVNGSSVLCDGDSVKLSVFDNQLLNYQWKDGLNNIANETTNSYFATKTGNYQLKVTDTNGCSNRTWIEPIVVNPTPSSPTISTSGSTTFCFGDSVTLSAPFDSGLEYRWLLEGGPTGADKNSLVTHSSGTYTLEVRNSYLCPATSTNIISVTANPLPSVPGINANGPLSFCDGKSVELSVGENAAMTYQWMDGDAIIDGEINNKYNAVATGDYKLLITNSYSCSDQTQSRQVNVSPSPVAPIITASGPLTFCVGDNVDLSVIDNAEYTYQWRHTGGLGIGIDQNSLSVSESGNYTVDASNSYGCITPSTNEITVTVNPNPIAQQIVADGPNNFCDYDSVQLSVPVAETGLSFQWKNADITIPDATDSYYYVNSTGDYRVLISNSSKCSSETPPKALNVFVSPTQATISLSGDTTFCFGNSAELSVPEDATAIYKWIKNDGATGINQNTLTVNSTGTYSLEVSNSNGCVTKSANTVNISVLENPENPQVITTGQTVFCEGNSILFSATYNPELSYQWKDGDVNLSEAKSSDYTATVSGRYKLEVSNADGCAVQTPEIPVTVNPTPDVPTISYSDPETFCQGDSLVLSVAVDPLVIYRWMKGGENVGGNTNSYTVKTTGNYDIEARTSLGCSSPSTKSVLVTVNPTPSSPVISVNGGNVFCAGDSSLLRVNGSEDLNYQWINESTTIADANTSSYYASVSGRYKVEIANSYGCKNQSAYENISVTPAPLKPTIAYSGDLTICEGETVLLNAVSNAADVHEWLFNNGSIGSNSTSLTADQSGTYKLKVTNDKQCEVFAENTVEITIHPNPATPAVINEKISFCDGDSTQLKGVDDPSVNYQWVKGNETVIGANTNVYYAKTTGDYKLRITNTSGCSVESSANSVEVKESPLPPRISYSGEIEFCEGEQIELYVPEVVGNTNVWLKDNSNVLIGSNNLMVSEEGEYKIRVSNSIGCEVYSTNTVPVIVNSYPLIPGISVSGDTTFCEGLSVDLSVTNDPSLSYQWMDGETIVTGATSNSYNATSSGNYKLSISNENGCGVFTQAKEVVVNRYPITPVIVAENYAEGECMNIDSIAIGIDFDEGDVNYKWLLGGETIPGENSAWIKGRIEEGNYKVEADYNGCITISDAQNIQFAEMPPTPQIYSEGPIVWYLVCSDTNALDIEWYYEGELIEGENDLIYVANQQLGKYEVSVSYGGCYAKSDPLWIPLGTEVESDPFKNLKIYPNPTSGLFTLEMDNSIMGELMIDIFNERGSKVINIKFMKETNHFKTTIDLSSQPPALYLINMMLDEYVMNRPLVVE
ncbi:FG-GAP-like repeat-containing protein [Bacteroidota bacterium]